MSPASTAAAATVGDQHDELLAWQAGMPFTLLEPGDSLLSNNTDGG
jgi:hypothetical protein